MQAAAATGAPVEFQSQTGSPSSSDPRCNRPTITARSVSIPNGKPILFRRRWMTRWRSVATSFNPKREAHPLQTQPTCCRAPYRKRGFNPKREAHPLQTSFSMSATTKPSKFQSQTGSPSSSDPLAVSRCALPMEGFNPKREAHPLQTTSQPLARKLSGQFQSQTGSPSSSDRAANRWFASL